ncbi:unnamed protein product [Oppiella nova]|uniref:Phosphatidylethanolamine-binding protein n=1 Tax=Oppiella nova TaxID=334625 RepID=A0A7R9QQD1_9ACAR|nr:unnamed protein product [Oppiella nova]CAG2171603.1 unnamed protein product [Oppiella nova]
MSEEETESKIFANRRPSLQRLDGIVPDVIDSVPNGVINVRYRSGVDINLGNEVTPTQVAEQPLVEWAADYGNYYTLVLTDPDVFGRNGPKYGEYKHWVVVNIPGTDIKRGRDLTEYQSSGPARGTGPHRYVFLVYKQPDIIETDSKIVNTYSLEGRLFFDVRSFARKYNLGEPVAINYYHCQFETSS